MSHLICSVTLFDLIALQVNRKVSSESGSSEKLHLFEVFWAEVLYFS